MTVIAMFQGQKPIQLEQKIVGQDSCIIQYCEKAVDFEKKHSHEGLIPEIIGVSHSSPSGSSSSASTSWESLHK